MCIRDSLWAEYADGKVTKEELNRQRYLYPLEAVGAGDSTLAKAYERDALTMIPTKSKLMPHAREVLEYLSGKYNLYILSNGFKELQSHKMRSSGIDEMCIRDSSGCPLYFSRIIRGMSSKGMSHMLSVFSRAFLIQYSPLPSFIIWSCFRCCTSVKASPVSAQKTNMSLTVCNRGMVNSFFKSMPSSSSVRNAPVSYTHLDVYKRQPISKEMVHS